MAGPPNEYTVPEDWLNNVTGPLNEYLSNGADVEAGLADGILVDAAASGLPQTYRVPTIHHLDESAIRRTAIPDGPNHVTWEVIGAAHVDQWSSDHTRIPSADPKPELTRDEELARRAEFTNYGQIADPNGAICQPFPRVGSMFPRRYSLDAALVALNTWIRTGERPPSAPPVERTVTEPTSAAESLARDGDGNAIGGLRSPLIDVPVARYNGEECVQAGTTVTFSSERLAELYPSHRSYVQRLLDATDRAVVDGFLLCDDAEAIMSAASASDIGGADGFTAAPACAVGGPSG